jgi:hypothetical protein
MCVCVCTRVCTCVLRLCNYILLLYVFQSACMSSVLTERIFMTVDTGLSYENLLRICQFGYSLAKYLTLHGPHDVYNVKNVHIGVFTS